MSDKEYRMWTSIFRNFDIGEPACREIKQEMRRWANRPVKAHSLQCEDVWSLKMRPTYPDSGEYITYYGIIPDNGEDYEYIKDCLWREIPNSPYDCTGKQFSNLLKVFRCPLGIGIIHETMLDV